jgi:hypothetical protein
MYVSSYHDITYFNEANILGRIDSNVVENQLYHVPTNKHYSIVTHLLIQII